MIHLHHGAMRYIGDWFAMRHLDSFSPKANVGQPFLFRRLGSALSFQPMRTNFGAVKPRHVRFIGG
jgi:hypothetical protein